MNRELSEWTCRQLFAELHVKNTEMNWNDLETKFVIEWTAAGENPVRIEEEKV